MQRVFTKKIGRYKKGDTKDWPLSTWKQILVSADAKAFKSIDDFSMMIDDYLKKKK